MPSDTEIVDPQNKCRSSDCHAVAAFTVYWPGQTSKMCQRCADRAVGIGQAMGFTPHVAPITSIEIVHGPRSYTAAVVEVPDAK